MCPTSAFDVGVLHLPVCLLTAPDLLGALPGQRQTDSENGEQRKENWKFKRLNCRGASYLDRREEFEDKYAGAEAAVVCWPLSGGGEEAVKAGIETVPFTVLGKEKKVCAAALKFVSGL